jgi:mono/diheme cytochrome c family protein/SAM-dependent methyltransferase
MIMAKRGSAAMMIAAAWAVLAAALAAQAPPDSVAGEPRTVWDGVYTTEQAARGALLYDQECASCHGPSGTGGGMAPALVGAAFSANYDGLTVGDLFDRNRNTMPPGKEGQIGAPENAAITAFMLQFNAFPAGPSELPSLAMALKSIQYVATKPSGPHQDNTEGREWIQRLERPERIPGLKIDDVIARLDLKPGMVVADIGAGTGAFTIPFAKAVAPGGRAIAVDVWPELLEYVKQKALCDGVANLDAVLAALDDPKLPARQVDIAFFHDVFHNTNDREGYLRVLASQLKADARIVIIEQEYDDPIARKWDEDEDRITPQQVDGWMRAIGFELKAEYDLFRGANNPQGTGMPARWFVIYARK